MFLPVLTAVSPAPQATPYGVYGIGLFACVTFFLLGAYGLRRGRVPTSSGTFDREKHPFRFWFFTILFLAGGLLALVFLLISLFYGAIFHV